MKTNQIATAVKDLFKGGVTPSEPTNTHVVLASQAVPEPVPDHGEKDGNGTLPDLQSKVGDRARVLKDIYARRAPQAQADAEETLPSTDEDGNAAEPEMVGKDLDAGEQEQTPDAGATTVAAQPVPATPAAPAAPEEMRTIIVEGQSMQVPISKIVDVGTRALQKETAADYRLELASKLLAEAQAQKAAVQPPAPGVAQSQSETQGLNEDQLAEMIQFGTREQAAAAIKALRTPAGPTPEAFQKLVTEIPAQVRQQMAFEEAAKFAQTEYGDILNDPYLSQAFLSEELRLRKTGDVRAHAELYKAIGDDMRVKLNRPKPGMVAVSPAASVAAPSTQGRTMEEKRQAKANAPAAPRLASARLDGEGSEPRPATRAEIIDRQRRARGFQPYSAQK